MPFNDEQLIQMSEEIAALLVKHLPAGRTAVLSRDTVQLRSKTCIQIVGSSVKHKAIFSLKAVLRRPPPHSLNVKCFTHHDA